MTITHYFKVLPRVNKTQFVNNFSSRKAHERNEVKVRMSGPTIGLLLTFLLDLDTKIQTFWCS